MLALRQKYCYRRSAFRRPQTNCSQAKHRAATMNPTTKTNVCMCVCLVCQPIAESGDSFATVVLSIRGGEGEGKEEDEELVVSVSQESE